MTVVIPAQDAEATIRRALRSVREQTLSPERILVVDDGSRDGTGQVAEEEGAEVLRLRPSRGVAAARNAGLERATTPFVAFLDADDSWLPGHLETATAAFGPGVGLVVAPALRVDETGRLSGRTWPDVGVQGATAGLLTGSLTVTTSGAVVDTAVARAAGSFDERFCTPSCEDLDLWLRIAMRSEVVTLSDPGVLYSVDDGERTAERVDGRVADRRALLAAHLARDPSAVAFERPARAWLELDLARLLLKHGRRQEARRAAWSSLLLPGHRVAAGAVLFLAALPDPAQRCARVLRRRLRRRS